MLSHDGVQLKILEYAPRRRYPKLVVIKASTVIAGGRQIASPFLALALLLGIGPKCEGGIHSRQADR